jgi:autotransporter-associated beta strand protein
LTVGGTSPSFISTPNGNSSHLGANTVFNVADVTGNANTDLTVSVPLMNQSGDLGSNAGGFTKTGAGKMLLTGALIYTGNTTIGQGTLAINGLPATATTATWANRLG